MRASVGGVSLMNIFIVFFIIVAFLLSGTVMYYKGYKVNSRIINALELYEGYNELSAAEIYRNLSSYGYRSSGRSGVCGKTVNGDDIQCLGEDRSFEFSVKCRYDTKRNGGFKDRYIAYDVTTYIYIDLPLGLGTIKLPITTRTNPIYQFTGNANGVGCFSS